MINLERVYKINSTLGVESNKFKKEFKLIESFSTLNKLDIPGKNITVFYKNENILFDLKYSFINNTYNIVFHFDLENKIKNILYENLDVDSGKSDIRLHLIDFYSYVQEIFKVFLIKEGYNMTGKKVIVKSSTYAYRQENWM